MIEIIEKAREIAKSIQNTSEYKELNSLKKQIDEDDTIQNYISEANIVNINLERELNNPEQDKDKIEDYKNKIQNINEKILELDLIVRFNEYREKMDGLMNHIYSIFIHAINGGEVDEFEYKIPTPNKSKCCGSNGGCGNCGCS